MSNTQEPVDRIVSGLVYGCPAWRFPARGFAPGAALSVPAEEEAVLVSNDSVVRVFAEGEYVLDGSRYDELNALPAQDGLWICSVWFVNVHCVVRARARVRSSRTDRLHRPAWAVGRAMMFLMDSGTVATWLERDVGGEDLSRVCFERIFSDMLERAMQAGLDAALTEEGILARDLPNYSHYVTEGARSLIEPQLDRIGFAMRRLFADIRCEDSEGQLQKPTVHYCISDAYDAPGPEGDARSEEDATHEPAPSGADSGEPGFSGAAAGEFAPSSADFDGSGFGGWDTDESASFDSSFGDSGLGDDTAVGSMPTGADSGGSGFADAMEPTEDAAETSGGGFGTDDDEDMSARPPAPEEGAVPGKAEDDIPPAGREDTGAGLPIPDSLFLGLTQMAEVPESMRKRPPGLLKRMRSKVRALLGARDGKAPAPAAQAQFRAAAPRRVVPGEWFPLNLVMFAPERQAEAKEIASMVADVRVEKQTGAYEVPTRAKVRVCLRSEDIPIKDSWREGIWLGSVTTFDYDVFVPDDCPKRQLRLTARVYVEEMALTDVSLIVAVGREAGAPVKVIRGKNFTAFVSYASQDRPSVAARLQGMETARRDIDLFFDRENLRRGEHWEERLYREIEARDIFYLFWSHNARDSEWVCKELDYALSHKRPDDIEPVPLESPEQCPPPAGLSERHFYDRWLHYTEGK